MEAIGLCRVDRVDGFAKLALAQTLPSAEIVSACGGRTPQAAYSAQNQKQAERRKGGAFYWIAFTHLKRGDHALALKQFDHAIEINPRNAEYYRGRAMAWL